MNFSDSLKYLMKDEKRLIQRDEYLSSSHCYRIIRVFVELTNQRVQIETTYQTPEERVRGDNPYWYGGCLTARDLECVDWRLLEDEE